MKTKEKTTVLFRKWNTGEVIALLPEIPSTANPDECLSYMAIGQHGAASPGITRSTQPATPEEYAPLKKEMEQMGYALKIASRIPTRARAARLAEINRYR